MTERVPPEDVAAALGAEEINYPERLKLAIIRLTRENEELRIENRFALEKFRQLERVLESRERWKKRANYLLGAMRHYRLKVKGR